MTWPTRMPEEAVEMTRGWKSQNDFHARLEISQSTRDSHIPTSHHFQREEAKTNTRRRRPNSWSALDIRQSVRAR
jgi:hypothetical protein